MTEAVGFHLVQDGMKLHREGHRDSTTAALIGIFLVYFFVLISIISMIVVVVNNKVTVVQLGSLPRLLGLATTLGAGLLVEVDLCILRGGPLGSIGDAALLNRGKRARQALRKHARAYPESSRGK
jgi:hypothetical protein